MIPLSDQTRERLACVAHETWASWMEHLFRHSHEDIDGSVNIPSQLVQRWRRQMATPYSHLSENEKDSDRKQADRVIQTLNNIPTTN